MPERGPALSRLGASFQSSSRGRRPVGQAFHDFPWFRFLVAAAFLADAERSSAVRDADAAPPFLPPFLLDTLVSALPRPLPDLLPPPDSLLTVAQARLSASFSSTPRFLISLFNVLGLPFLFVRVLRFIAAGHVWVSFFEWFR